MGDPSLRIDGKIYDFLVVGLTVLVPGLFLGYSGIEPYLVVSFLLIDILLGLYLLVILFFDKKNVANVFSFIFFYLFFLIAPILQISRVSETTLVNTMPINVEQLFFSNLLTLLFLSVFLIGYLVNKGLMSPPRPKRESAGYLQKEMVLFTLVVISLFAVLLATKDIRSKVLIVEMLESSVEDESLSTGLFRSKVLYNIPLATYFFYFFSYKGKTKWWFLGVLLLMVVVTKNPLLERRNALGPTYLSILYIHIEPYLKSNRAVFLMFFGLFVVFFPLSSLLTHSNFFIHGLRTDDLTDVLTGHFTELHYDAWANLTAGVEYASVNGHTFGKQLLGALFFFVPRSLWEGKAFSSGQVIGDYLIAKYDMWFNNLSFPIHAEAYLDFGIVGVVVYAFLFSMLVCWLGNRMNDAGSRFKAIAIYIGICLMFILRGALMSTIANTVGALIALWVIPGILMALFARINWNLKIKRIEI